MQATGTLYLNDKPIGTVTNFNLNLKGTKMKRKHIIEQQDIRIEELEHEFRQQKDRSNELAIQRNELRDKLNEAIKKGHINHKVHEKMKKHYQTALEFINNITTDVYLG